MKLKKRSNNRLFGGREEMCKQEYVDAASIYLRGGVNNGGGRRHRTGGFGRGTVWFGVVVTRGKFGTKRTLEGGTHYKFVQTKYIMHKRQVERVGVVGDGAVGAVGTGQVFGRTVGRWLVVSGQRNKQ